MRCLLNQHSRFVDIMQGEVLATGNVDQHTLSAVDRSIIE